VNLGDAVLTGIIGWLLAKVFKPAEGGAAKETRPAPSSSSAPSTTPRVPQGATAPSPTAAPWPRGETSVPAPKAAQRLTDEQKGVLVSPDGSRHLAHVVVPSGAPYGATTRMQYFKTGPGRAAPQIEEAAVIARERAPYDRSYWRPKRKVTPGVATRAKSLLAQWRQGGIVFDGPRTFAGRVQFRMTQHSGKRAVEAWEPAPPFVA